MSTKQQNEQQPTQMLEIIEGAGKVRARMTKPGPIAALGQCAPGLHCAHHGSGPFGCCRCGAEFEMAPELKAVRS